MQCVSLITQRPDVSTKELAQLNALPSTIIADHPLYYGEYPLIGSLPLSSYEDYPILYGQSIQMGEQAVCYQQGRVFCKRDREKALYTGFRNNSVAFALNMKEDVLKQCIEANSNTPYWLSYSPNKVEQDLRNPKHAEALQRIRRQFGL